MFSKFTLSFRVLFKASACSGGAIVRNDIAARIENLSGGGGGVTVSGTAHFNLLSHYLLSGKSAAAIRVWQRFGCFVNFANKKTANLYQ